MESASTVNEHLAEIGRKGGQRKCPHQKYGSNAERQRAYRARKGNEPRRMDRGETQRVEMDFDFGS